MDELQKTIDQVRQDADNVQDTADMLFQVWNGLAAFLRLLKQVEGPAGEKGDAVRAAQEATNLAYRKTLNLACMVVGSKSELENKIKVLESLQAVRAVLEPGEKVLDVTDASSEGEQETHE